MSRLEQEDQGELGSETGTTVMDSESQGQARPG